MRTHSLDEIRYRINAGDREGARLALGDLLKADADNVDAWALLAILLKDPAQQAECYRQVLRIDPENRQAAAWLEALASQVPESTVDEIDQLLQTLDLPDVDEEIVRQLRERTPSAGPSEQGPVSSGVRFEEQSFLDRTMRRTSGDAFDDKVQAILAEGVGDLPKPGLLDPEEIIRLAGGALPPEERRECHNCGAVVSRSESRCPWCSVPLGDEGEG
jgi:tetratricopeptide (TPR) repeat protein